MRGLGREVFSDWHREVAADRLNRPGDRLRVCREVVLLCRRLKLFAEGIVAIDGSKFKVVNNRDKNFTSNKIQVRMQQLEHSINRYLTELDRADRDPAIVLPVKAARLKEKIAKIKQQLRGFRQIEQQLQSSEERQVSLTDPDARSMATSRLGSAVVGYNVQTAVDTRHHLIAAHAVTNAVTDRGQLAAMAKAAKEASDHPSPIVLADRGYFEGYHILGIIALFSALRMRSEPDEELRLEVPAKTHRQPSAA